MPPISASVSASTLVPVSASIFRIFKRAFREYLPGLDPERGGLHPISRTLEHIADIFGRLGYELADGPENEDE